MIVNALATSVVDSKGEQLASGGETEHIGGRSDHWSRVADVNDEILHNVDVLKKPLLGRVGL